jgi:hypothetical protein
VLEVVVNPGPHDGVELFQLRQLKIARVRAGELLLSRVQSGSTCWAYRGLFFLVKKKRKKKKKKKKKKKGKNLAKAQCNKD